MKKKVSLVLALVCVLGLVGCASPETDGKSGDLPPMITIDGYRTIYDN